MRLLKAKMPSSFRLVLMGDLHIGSNGCHTGGIMTLMDEIAASSDMYFVCMGDWVDAVCSDDKRFHYTKGELSLPLQQCALAKELISPAAHRCLAALKGNHEDKLHRFGDITQDLIAAPLRIPYGGYVCKLALEDSWGPLFKSYLWHGPLRGSVTSNAKDYAQRQANMKAAVRRYLENKASDSSVMALGHTHRLLIMEPAPKLLMSDDGVQLKSSYLPHPEPGARYIEPDSRWYVNTGSYLKSQVLDEDSYAELAGYDPIELGHAEIVVEDRKIVAVKRMVCA